MNSHTNPFANPFRPGAGHMPPFLAGRETEHQEFQRLLTQAVILENMVLTGLRGVGKTVLLDTFKPSALQANWLWVGTDLSESTSLSERNIAIRLLTDLSVMTSSIAVARTELRNVGFREDLVEVKHTLSFDTLSALFEATPGLVADKIKMVLEVVWAHLANDENQKGLIFAYDEAQNLADHAARGEFPLSLLLDVFQSIQKKDIPFMLLLTGLPTLFPKLVEARTFAERMFRVVFLDRLAEADSREAILKPVEKAECPVLFDDPSVETIVRVSAGYPYFIQFICREVYDAFLPQVDAGQKVSVPVNEIVRKLDSDFFAGRWARATDRQRELLSVIAHLENCDLEFTVREVVEKSKETLDKGFGPSQTNQMLAALCDAGLIYKIGHGRYSFAMPLLGDFIRRQNES